MDKGGIGRWALFGLSFVLLMFIMPKACGGSNELQPIRELEVRLPETRATAKLCDLWGPRFHARLTTEGAGLVSFNLTTAKYRKKGEPIDLVTTPDHELHRQLFIGFRNDAVAPLGDAKWNVAYDSLDWNLRRADGKRCDFFWSDDRVELTKTVSVTERPYELEVHASIKNLAEARLRHAVTAGTDAWRYHHEVSGSMFRQSPFLSHVECVSQESQTTRLAPDAFEASDFEKEAPFHTGGTSDGWWYQAPGSAGYAAVSTAYFSHALVATGPPGEAACQLQIWERWHADQFKSKNDDPNYGSYYRGRIAYPAKDLGKGESASYSLLSYIGPKERDVLAVAGGGTHHLSELIDLGFFSVIAKVLVAFLLKVHGVVGNWGLSIVILTFTARTLLFPLMWPSIRNMVRMRELKPEMDELTAKFKDDAQQRGVAQMELWRKHNVNPLKGCLPQLASMPVWFALYTTLQTAVELYNIPLLWFPDLSGPDPYYILPFVIGATSFVQQRLMPPQQDPVQQKMMLYFMPAMFMVFMLVLPSGLGIYMFTNGCIGIAQQRIVEFYVKRQAGEKKSEPAKTAPASPKKGSRAAKPAE